MQNQIVREFDAPKHLVYRAWTTPELIKRWWGGDRGEVTSAEVVMLVGGCPASDRPCESAIEKQPEWAAAMSSSGLVRPLGASARDSQVSSKVPSPDESRLTAPLPVASGPSQRVVAVRTVATMTSPFTAGRCGFRVPAADSPGRHLPHILDP